MDTRTRALNLGRHYLQTLGFNGFSFQTIADDLGIKKASLHYYFASKEDLGLSLIEEYQKAYDEWVARVSPLSATKKLDQMVHVFYKMALDEKKICPTGVFCSDFNSISKNMKKRLLEFHNTQKTWLIETLKQGVCEKSFRKDLNIDATADLIMTFIQGGLQVARLRGETESFRHAGKALIKSLS
jgi:TetR/AcrR family transcriptional repressor of nem operon